MELSQAIEHASAYLIPGFLNDDATLTAERLKNEDALKTLLDAWNAAPKDSLPFSFDRLRADLPSRTPREEWQNYSTGVKLRS